MQDFNLDRLNNVNARRAGQAAMAACDRLQNFTAEEQAAGVAVIFRLLLCKHQLNLDAAMRVAQNLIDRAGQETPELRAAKHYVENEI